MKKYISGLITGIIITLSMSTLAAGLNVVPNRFPIFVNGNLSKIEAYNINGFTFLKLADVGKFFNSEVLFNQTKSIIEINSLPSPTPTVAPKSNNLTEVDTMQNTITQPTTYEKDGFMYAEIDGVKYVYYDSVGNILKTKKLSFNYLQDKNKLQVIKEDLSDRFNPKKTILIDNITYNIINHRVYILYDYYVNNIMPLLK